MPQLLLELFSEEIPARMQAQAGRDLARMAEEHLKKAGLSWESLQAFAGPRRLTLVVEGLPAETAAKSEEIKGPRVNAPDQAIEGFLRKTGLARADLTERDGVFYAVQSAAGRATTQIIAEAIPAIMAAFTWPKSMRSGTSAFRWVRPLKRILCLFDEAVVPFEAGGVASGDLTEGHRFMGPDRAPFVVTDFADYAAKLHAHYVELDQSVRKQRILDGARAVCAAEGLELVEDEGLLEEVSGLSEWPVPILGAMDPAFLDLPPEVIRTSMRTHQKYFAVRRPGEAGLAPNFVVVANIEPTDGGAVIAAGNAKVLSARLSDARFFWDEDRKQPLEDRLEKLKGVTFHAKLGTLYERVERIEALAREIAPLVGCTPEQVELAGKAARLCKADLGTGMVGEFPELQGIMGGYYARAEGSAGVRPSRPSPAEPAPQDEETGRTAQNAPHPEVRAERASKDAPWFAGLSEADIHAVADAVRDHYKPVGPSDTVPTAPVTVAVALADKLDTLVGFFAIDEKPTGSKDPFALRRAALGVIRLLFQTDRHIHLSALIGRPLIFYAEREATRASAAALAPFTPAIQNLSKEQDRQVLAEIALGSIPAGQAYADAETPRFMEVFDELRLFFSDRLKVLLRDEGKRHDLVDAVFALGDDDLVRITRRVEALSAFLASEDGANLLAGYKRATNILKAEEKKAGGPPSSASRPLPPEGEDYTASTPPPEGEVPRSGGGGLELNPELSTDAPPEEAALAAALRVEQGRVDEALAAEDFTAAMQHLAHLRAPVDAFFDKVLVNDPDPAVRLNRLRLLTQVRDTANRVADFSLISG